MEFIEQKCVCINYNNICTRPLFLAAAHSIFAYMFSYFCYFFSVVFVILVCFSAGISFGELFALCRKFAVVKIVSCVPFTGHRTSNCRRHMCVFTGTTYTSFHDIP